MILQILIKQNGQIKNEYRYSHEAELLYRQNRSYDIRMPSYEYQFELNKMIEKAELVNCYIEVNEIEENTLWSQLG